MFAMAFTWRRPVMPSAARCAFGKRWCRSTERGAVTVGSSRSRMRRSLKSASASRRFKAAWYADSTGDLAEEVSSRFGSEMSQ